MSGYLWKYYLEDDVDRFRQLLETAAYTARSGANKSQGATQITGLGFGSPGGFSTSPTLTTKGKRPQDAHSFLGAGQAGGSLTLTRQDVNHRDPQGRTLLHLVSSASSESAYEFAAALLEHPLTDVYLQDSENGWTALHRAFYCGNISIAHAILARDSQDAFGHGTGNLHHKAGGLIKIKDNEGNGPFDLFEMTFLDKDGSAAARPPMNLEIDSDDESLNESTDLGDMAKSVGILAARGGSLGDDVFTFGSNKNITLGFGDEDDRQFPERVALKRPDHLYHKFYREHMAHMAKQAGSSGPETRKSGKPSLDDLPAVVRNRPITIQNVHMGKFHTAVLTTDPESNLYLCGQGRGGRLGTGDESTRFQFVCIDGGALARKKISAVALGQSHTLALSKSGEVFSWGSNGYGQLGYGLPRTSPTEDPVQTLPRQVFGPLKRELVLGIAASRFHSVAYTESSLYTWGKNEGQLGLVDSDARSLDFQDTPRKVAASLFNSSIVSASAIDRATIVLLENHEVWVFANYGYAKVPFNLEGFTNYFLQQSFRATKYEAAPNTICKVIGSGDTICAMSTNGDVYTVSVGQPAAGAQGSASTTNPSKIKAALSPAQRIWSNKKTHMAARDVDVDQNGSIILVTDTGSVWRRTKRAKIKDASAAGTVGNKAKDFKFSRISGLTRVVAVRASGFGAYAAVRRDCDKTRKDIEVSDMSLGADLIKLSPFEFAGTGIPETRSAMFGADMLMLDQKLGSTLKEGISVEDMIKPLIMNEPRIGQPYDLRLSSARCNIQIPIHSFLLGARSKTLRIGLEAFVSTGTCLDSDVFTIRRGDDNLLEVVFENIDLLTVFYLVLYLYTEEAVRYGQMPIFPIGTKNSVPIHRQAQRDLVKLAARLDMGHLASAIERSLNNRTLHRDMEEAIKDPDFFSNADVIVQLADAEVPVHGALVCQRCPFFEGMFKGRAGGAWLAERRKGLAQPSDAIRIDLSHIDSGIFAIIMRYLYADTGSELFDEYVSEDLDGFMDHVIEVMGVANELMLDRLCEVCQHVLGQYVTVRNVCQLVNAVAPCSVDVFKRRALEYICMNLEAVLQHNLLDDLDEGLFFELDEVARQMQMDCSLMSRSGALEAGLLERHPELSHRIEIDRRAKIDSIVLLNKYADAESKQFSSSFRAGSFHDFSDTPSSLPRESKRRVSKDATRVSPSPMLSPALKSQRSINDLMFDMDHDEEDSSDFEPTTPSKTPQAQPSPSINQHLSKSGKPLGKPIPISREPSALDLGLPLQQRSSLSEAPTPRTPGRPWGASPAPTDKLDLKSILEETPSKPISSSPFLTTPGSTPRGSTSNVIKISQKERKRQQAQAAAVSPLTSPSTSSSLKAVNPWQTTSKAKPIVAKVQTAHAPSISPSPSTRPQLTMRQTLSRASSTGPKEPESPAIAVVETPARRPSAKPMTPSSPPTRPTPSSTKSGSNKTPSRPPHEASSSKIVSAPAAGPSGPGFSISDTAPQLQSVRHTPMPQRPSALSGLFSMAEILAYEQAEKNGIKEAANSKRSLAEIQAEQEFLDWWEQESQRVKDEEEQETRRRDSLAKKGDSGLPRAPRRRTRHKADSKATDAKAANDANSASQPATATAAAGQGEASRRRRDHHRGRGREKTADDNAAGPALGQRRDSARHATDVKQAN